MIPQKMNELLKQALPERTWENRLRRDGPYAFLEFGPLDVDRLLRLGIKADNLGPHLVVCMWDDENPIEIGGYLVVDNLSMGRPSMGGIRMLPEVTPAAIYNLARGMTLKNAAADLPFGGGKSGIVAPVHVNREEREQIIRGFANLIHRYRKIYLPGPDVGTNDDDMKTIAIENGLDCALSKTTDMGGNCIDELGGAAQSVVVAIDSLLPEMERLRVLPQFANLQVPNREDLSVLIQGFGAVGTHVARLLAEEDPAHAPRITGVSDHSGYLFHEKGLPVSELLKQQKKNGDVVQPFFLDEPEKLCQSGIKFSTGRDDLLRESAYCFVPAAPVANYLDVDDKANPSMTVDRMGEWELIVEGANTYSPDPVIRAARARMERSVYWQKGVLIATDFLVNSGGVIYAAQEYLVKTPDHLRIPNELLGNRSAVDDWLKEHQADFSALADDRRRAAAEQLNRVIKRNMIELVDLLVANPDTLPCEAAEQIGIARITSSESHRTVADVMESIPTISVEKTVKEAAELLISEKGDMLAVVCASGDLCGVITEWDITRASASACAQDMCLQEIMSREVITVCPEDSILDAVKKLELYEFSAMPVVTKEGVSGVISSDMLARRTLYRLLQAT
jgi:glutamate dehydrogenase (NAD(P)+)